MYFMPESHFPTTVGPPALPSPDQHMSHRFASQIRASLIGSLDSKFCRETGAMVTSTRDRASAGPSGTCNGGTIVANLRFELHCYHVEAPECVTTRNFTQMRPRCRARRIRPCVNRPAVGSCLQSPARLDLRK